MINKVQYQNGRPNFINKIKVESGSIRPGPGLLYGVPLLMGVQAERLHSDMMAYSFSEFLMAKEGLLLPDRRPSRGLTRMNPFPATNARRVRIRGVGGRKKYIPFPATVKAVVPPRLVPTNLRPY